MIIDLNKYKTIVFDCDGVILNSNEIKSHAFYKATKHYGHETASKLVDYHIRNGGISRYEKIKYFLNYILCIDFDEEVYKDILKRFSIAVYNGLLSCEIAEGLAELKRKTEFSNWLIVSGGDQIELRRVFEERKIESFFNGGIFGSPDNKNAILCREINNKNIKTPALFIGDSKYDYEVAQEAGLDFVFLYRWTEVSDYISWTDSNLILRRRDILGIL